MTLDLELNKLKKDFKKRQMYLEKIIFQYLEVEDINKKENFKIYQKNLRMYYFIQVMQKLFGGKMKEIMKNFKKILKKQNMVKILIIIIQ